MDETKEQPQRTQDILWCDHGAVVGGCDICLDHIKEAKKKSQPFDPDKFTRK